MIAAKTGALAHSGLAVFLRSESRQGKIFEMDGRVLGPVVRQVRVAIVLEERQSHSADLHLIGTIDIRGRSIGDRRDGRDVIILEDTVAAGDAPMSVLRTPLPVVSLYKGALPGKRTTPFWLPAFSGVMTWWKLVSGLKSL